MERGSTSRAAGGGGAPAAVDKAADFANYFCTYAFLYHQKDMLSDRVRMEAYHSAVFQNARHFKDKVVLDVGTGSGILAVWAAQAGASKVYAVEATDMAEHAKVLVRANGVDSVVEVIQGSMEDITLPEKVDVIISEWMGYFLVRESMFDSVIVARDRFLKPDGKMYPSHARMWFAPIKSGIGETRVQDYEHSMADWSVFSQDTLDEFGVDMRALSDAYDKEQRKYFLQTACWNTLYPNQVMGVPALVKEMDCKTATLEDISTVSSDFSMPVFPSSSEINGFAGWFDVQFKGCKEDPADVDVELTTAPSVERSTHWGQQVFIVQPGLAVGNGDEVVGNLTLTRASRNHRLLDASITCQVKKASGVLLPKRSMNHFIE